MASPYENLPNTAFWRYGVGESSPKKMLNVYKKKWELNSGLNVATAGSCFAQHISRYMRKNGFSVMDTELPPPEVSIEDQEKHGYGLYSARYGNIYTVHQLLQLAKEAFDESLPQNIAWEKNSRYYDALRPAVEPSGFDSKKSLYDSRNIHLASVRRMLLEVDVFIFTLGLTEAWVHTPSGTVFPTAPETVAGQFDPTIYAFKNFNYSEIIDAFTDFLTVVRKHRLNKPELKVILTVSPVPLTATAAGKHVLLASTYSKSVLRAVAGYLSDNYKTIDYFPSYEIITNPAARSSFYDENLRTVKAEGVSSVMGSFFSEHQILGEKEGAMTHQVDNDDVQCEEVLLETFSAGSKSKEKDNRKLVVFFGDSHLSGVKGCIEKYFKKYQDDYNIVFIPLTWMKAALIEIKTHNYLTAIELKDEYKDLLPYIPTPQEMQTGAHVCLVGVGILGDGVIRAHGLMSPGGEDNKGHNPVLPVIGSKVSVQKIINGEMELSEFEDFEKIKKAYVHNLNIRMNIQADLSNIGFYRSVHWIASPDMVERTARFRFGDDYVDSQAHALHTRIAKSHVQHVIVNDENKGWLITHPSAYEESSGFTRNQFAFNDAINDIHTNADFYKEAVKRYFEIIS